MGKMAPILKTRNPLNYLTDRGSYTHSTIVGITGPKRSGKSLLLARLLVLDLHKGLTVWSTMPAHMPKAMIKDGYKRMRTEAINWNSLYMLGDEYVEGTIGLDEGIYWDDSRASLSMRNKLINTIMNQVGHRNLNVYYTVKSSGWMDRRLQFETDIEIRCFDMALTPWGRSNHVRRGEFIRLEFYDKSGAFTGHQYDPKYRPWPFTTIYWKNASRWWDAYDTKEIVGIEEMFTRVKVDMRQRTITNKGGEDDAIKQSLYEIASKMLAQGDTVDCNSLWYVAAQTGIEGDPRTLGRYLKQLNVKRLQRRGGDVYDLTNLQENPLGGLDK